MKGGLALLENKKMIVIYPNFCNYIYKYTFSSTEKRMVNPENKPELKTTKKSREELWNCCDKEEDDLDKQKKGYKKFHENVLPYIQK